MIGTELRVRPGRGRVAHGLHLGRRCHRQLIVIALNQQRSLSHQLLSPLDHRRRIGAIAHQITEHSELLCTMLARMRQTGIKSLNVGMNI